MRRLVAAILLAALAGCSRNAEEPSGYDHSPQKSSPTAAARKPRPGTELRPLLVGKTDEEVKTLLGKPDDARSYNEHSKAWKYAKAVLDPDSGTAKDLVVGFERKDGKFVCDHLTW